MGLGFAEGYGIEPTTFLDSRSCLLWPRDAVSQDGAQCIDGINQGISDSNELVANGRLIPETYLERAERRCRLWRLKCFQRYDEAAQRGIERGSESIHLLGNGEFDLAGAPLSHDDERVKRELGMRKSAHRGNQGSSNLGC